MFLQIFLRSILSLMMLFIITKWIGCRQISEMSMFDYINGITIGSIAAELASSDIDIWTPIIAMIIYGVAAFVLSWLSDKSLILRRFIVGRPYVLYQNETFMYCNMKKNKIDVSEFLTAARGAGYFDLSQIQSAILESNGKISFLPKAEHRPMTPQDMQLQPQKEYVFANVILEGRIMSENLKHMGRDINWLKKQMQIHNINDEKEVFLGICDGNNDCYFFKKEKEEKQTDVLL